MKILAGSNEKLARLLIPEFDTIENWPTKIRYGLLAGWLSFVIVSALFVLKLTLGIMSGSVSLLANAFHLISHTANSVVLIVSFWLKNKPATKETPFGHGRIEHVAPLIISIFLFVSGIRIGEESVHHIIEPHSVHYWEALPWILLATILVKIWMGQFIRYLGRRINSQAVLATARHHSIEAGISFTVILGLVFGRYLHLPVLDGSIGLLVSLWLLYLGVQHAREAIIPLLGQAPSRDLVEGVRRTARTVDGVKDAHEIIIHDYGNMYLISLHAEIPEEYGAFRMHEIAELVEEKLRDTYGGEAVCHTDPLLKRTEFVQKVESQFTEVIESFSVILGYHDFRIIAKSPKQIILAADIDVHEDVPQQDYPSLKSRLEELAQEKIQDVAYTTFYITPKFAY